MEKKADIFDVEVCEVQNLTCSKVRDILLTNLTILSNLKSF